ncbi:hypothetical protein DM02DRAFT_648821 [Periconia macrospinosa]|uniref:PWWP domain-containing protein n=1 Tax=Periconia macrospinosa TaxID=97972 RepID=A0A2V1EDH9_9PLEO|nr:hypothetical protein DM02DRAFT_648821 [Periconia macrospinosa]
MAMEPNIGGYVLYQQLRAPPWPAFVCPEELAPAAVAERQPHGFYSLIMLIKKSPEFKYVLPGDTCDYDPFPDPDVIAKHDGLKEAYDRIQEAMEFGHEVEYWRHFLDKRSNPMPISDRPSVSGDENEDADILEAIRLSLMDQNRPRTFGLPSPSPSPTAPKPDIRSYFSAGACLDASTSHSPQSKRQKVNHGDVIEGELNFSDAYVEFLVGPEKQSFIVPKSAVDKRSYFSSRHHAYLRTKGTEGWSIEIPSLASMNPDHFKHVAKYLENDQFGPPHITDENRVDAFTECAEAWVIADTLGMHDLLQHIVHKLNELVPWDPLEVLSFATIAFDDTNGGGILPEEHTELREMLAGFLADQYYRVLSMLGMNFVKKMNEFPGMGEMIHTKLAEKYTLMKKRNQN